MTPEEKYTLNEFIKFLGNNIQSAAWNEWVKFAQEIIAKEHETTSSGIFLALWDMAPKSAQFLAVDHRCAWWCTSEPKIKNNEWIIFLSDPPVEGWMWLAFLDMKSDTPILFRRNK